MRNTIAVFALAFTAQGSADDPATQNALKDKVAAKLLDKLCDLAHNGHPGYLAYVQPPSTTQPLGKRWQRKVAKIPAGKGTPLQRGCALKTPKPTVARSSSSTMTLAKGRSTPTPVAASRNIFDLLWYTLYHSWRTWYFTSLFILTYMSAARFNPQTVLGLLLVHPGFYLTFFAISKGVYDADWKCIEDGLYKMPYDAHLGGAFQWMRPDRIIAHCKDASAISDRASRDGYDELPATYRKPPTGSYPDYYLRTFHYQTDGWLSDASAAKYEMSTESLFTGIQDAMQRMGLVAIKSWLDRRTSTAPVELLDAGCGTGRFLCQMAHNFKSFRFTALDLSPYYLDATRRSYSELQKSSNLPPAEFVNANMEKLPFPDASKDVIVCTYVFHELPPLVRQRVAQEFFRVLRPGGLCVLMDSAQKGDLAPDLEGALQWFPRTFHEPYYMSWLSLDLRRLFEGLGFQFFSEGQRHVSKMGAWVKPRA